MSALGRVLSSERSAIGSALLALLLIDLLLDNWLLAGAVTLAIYIVWLYFRLNKLQQWIDRGTRTNEVYDDDGFIGLIVRRLYQQKKSYNERKKRTKEILGRLNRNISALPDATVLLSRDFAIEWCNQPAHYLLNIHRRNDLGQRIGNLIRDPQFLYYLRAPEQTEFIEIKSPLDSRLILQLKVVQIGENQYLLTARNVSDQRRLQESLKNFVANASHELKTPLTVISGHLEMLEAEKNLSPGACVSLATAQKQALRMRHLIDDLLLLSQVESYQLQPNEGDSLWVSEVMANVLAALNPQHDQVHLRLGIPPDFKLSGVRAEIESICLNLIENAQKYSTPETPIMISWSENVLGEFSFSVADQGAGIGTGEIELITRRYYRSAAARVQQSEGSGLGLAIVKQSINKHGGILQIESQPGQGSCFTVTFPSYRCSRHEPGSARVFSSAEAN